ncbi:hypothetical protein EVJ22_08020 [Exiguobacterium sp. SH0S7]|uniref:beta strand repeat-containing protein n=1 Tax=Exiguobacterium sp. SH0S7 TaxID=2510951 RepID=UPI00103A3E11|nr:hypothetical protein [Exiguobacterium sp. SH0S7]TCI71228.1 hypothetical protein EVJ22_08020 [Exiguobacterium sp. SH0S7]
MAKKKQFVTAAAAFAVAASAVAPAITADAATQTVRLSSDYVRSGNLDATLDKEYKGSEIHWYKSSVDMNKLGVFQTAKGFVKGKGIKVEKSVRVLNFAQDIQPSEEIVLEQGVPASGLRIQPVLFADGNLYNKPVSVSGFETDKVGEFEGRFTYANKAYGSVTKTVKYKVVATKVELTEVKSEVMDDVLSVTADVKNLKDGEKVELVIYAGRDMNAALPAVEAEVKDGKLTVKSGKLPAGNHSFILRSGEVKTEVMNFVVEAPMVKEVKAINAKEVVVTFNKPVNKETVFSNVSTGTIATGAVTVSRTTASTTANENVTSVTGKLSEDGKSLTLTAASATYFNGTYALTVADSVKTTEGKSFAAFAGTLSVSDAVSPSVNEVTYDTITNEVVVTLSEPVVSVPDVIRLNGNPVSGVTFVTGSNNKQVKFTKPSSIASGTTASVYVAGATDANGNILTAFNGNVTFTNDASSLAVASITQVSSNVAKVVFNKSLASNDSTIDSALNVIKDGAVLNGADVVAALDTSDSSNKTVLITIAGTAPDYFYGTSSSKALTFVFANNVITDVFGKTLAATTQNVTMNKDVAGPTFVSSKIASDNAKIEVELSEEISSSVDATKITVRKDGVALQNAVTAVKKSGAGNEKVLVISLNPADLDANGKLVAGTYSIRLDEGAVVDVNLNKNALITSSVTKTASTSDLTASVTNQGATANVFEVAYNEDVTTASALNVANYKLDGAALPAGTDIYFKGGAANRTVVIALPENSINIGSTATPANARLAVSGVQTGSGKTVVATSGTVLVKDNTAALLTSAQKLGNTLVLTFNENLGTSANDTAIADVLANYEITSGSNTVVAGSGGGAANASLVAGSNNKVQITFSNVTGTNYNASETITIKTTSTGGDVTDANGVHVKGGVTVTAN